MSPRSFELVPVERPYILQRQFIPRVRELLDEEMANADRAGGEYLHALCALLWSNGDPQDSTRIAKAKFLDFDAGCTIDGEFLVCGSLQ